MKNPFKRKSKAERMANNTKAYLCSMLNTKTAAQLKVVLERTKEAIVSALFFSSVVFNFKLLAATLAANT